LGLEEYFSRSGATAQRKTKEEFETFPFTAAPLREKYSFKF
jgi:hypothetical protein